MIALSVNNLVVSYKTIKRKSIKNIFKLNKKESFVAIDNVSFDIEKGSVVGIIGKNGSGKSTLLKTIANIFSSDSGSINLYGAQVSLLSLGIGFESALTGYENIFLSGMLLGFTKNEILSKIDEIISFSELGEFIYKPVKSYSSGMYSKLAFSISAILKTDILLIDEILSVGDEHFKEKSYNKILELINNKDRTVLIVSHSLGRLREICNEVIWLDNGKIKMIGEANLVIDKYKKYMDGAKK